MKSYLLRIMPHLHYGIFSLIIGLSAWNCKKDSPSQPEEPRGLFKQKIVYTSMKLIQNQGPFITVTDLYDDNGKFGIFNRKELVEGIGPALSPDQSWIIYQKLGNEWDQWRINVDGSGNQRIPIEGNYILESPKISPDGKMLASTFLIPGNDYKGRHLGVVPVTGGVIKTVYADPGWSILPEWSADGKKIYFAWADYNNRYGHNIPGSVRAKAYIISINLDGTGWRAISDTVSGLATDLYPSVSPEGNQIVFTSQRNFQDGIFPEIFIMNTDGSNMRQVSYCVGCQRHGDHFDAYTMDDKPLWTKDDKHILFERQDYTYNHDARNYTMREDIYIINIDGSSLQKLTDNGISSLTKRGTR
jgi:Tol biopolymer transport system component